MSAKRSAGLLLYRRRHGAVEVLVVHMGGPFWARKDAGAWSIPKGEYEPDEDPFAVAIREFTEELGSAPDVSSFVDLGSARQSSGKVLTIWAAEGDFDAGTAVSNTFELEWPKGSGRVQTFPEVDRAEWLGIDAARGKLVKGQVSFLDRLLAALGDR